MEEKSWIKWHYKYINLDLLGGTSVSLIVIVSHPRPAMWVLFPLWGGYEVEEIRAYVFKRGKEIQFWAEIDTEKILPPLSYDDVFTSIIEAELSEMSWKVLG